MKKITIDKAVRIPDTGIILESGDIIMIKESKVKGKKLPIGKIEKYMASFPKNKDNEKKDVAHLLWYYSKGKIDIFDNLDEPVSQELVNSVAKEILEIEGGDDEKK